MQKLSGKSGRIKIGEAKAITGASGTTTITITCVGHGLSAGMFVLISSVGGMTDANNNGKGWLVESAPTADTFTIVPATATSQTYTTGGSARRIIPITEWNIKGNSEVGEANDSETGEWKNRLKGRFKDWDGSYSALYHDGQEMPPLDDELEAEYDVDENNYYSGSAIFNGFDIGVKIEGAQASTISGTFMGNGELTLTNS